MLDTIEISQVYCEAKRDFHPQWYFAVEEVISLYGGFRG